MKLVGSVDDLQENIDFLEKARKSSGKSIARQYRSLIRRGTCFLPYLVGGALCFAPSRFLGYRTNTFKAHAANKDKDGRETNKVITAILGAPLSINRAMEMEYRGFCERNNISPTRAGTFGANRKFWITDLIKDEADRVALDEIDNNPLLTQTQKTQLRKARIGQGRFREEVIEHWKRCCITECSLIAVLKASHIKPWHSSTDAERLDKFNGLLLSPNCDALFDQGYISFNDDGRLKVSPGLERGTVEALIGSTDVKVKLAPQHKTYLAFHRKHVFQYTA